MPRLLVFAVLAVCLSADFASAQAPPPTAPPAANPENLSADVLLRNKRLAEQYAEFESALARVSERMRRSAKPEDQQKAAALQEALKVANEEGIEKRFQRLVELLEKNKVLGDNEISAARRQNVELTDVLQRIIDILSSEDDEARRKNEIKRLTDLLKELDKVIFEQKLARANTEAGRVKSEQLADGQKKVTDRTEKLEERAGQKNAKPKDGESKDGKPKDGKPKDGEPKDGKPQDGKPKDGQPKDGKPKDGQPKDGQPQDGKPKDGKPQDGKPKDGQPKDGQPKDGQPPPKQNQPPQPGQKPLQDALKNQKQAEQSLQKDDKPKGSDDQDKAIKDLVKAREELEKRLKQLREEELEKLLRGLEDRVRVMLAEQIEVYEATRKLHETIEKLGGSPARPEQQKALTLGDRETKLVRFADESLELLKDEGSSVAFALGFRNVRGDLLTAARRLERADTGKVTQVVEESIIAQLKEMLEALKKAQQDLKKPPPPPNPNDPNDGQPPPKALLDKLQELKLIRLMQIQVNLRTKAYHEQYPAEQADAEIGRELRELSKRQLDIYEATRKLATGVNK